MAHLPRHSDPGEGRPDRPPPMLGAQRPLESRGNRATSHEPGPVHSRMPTRRTELQGGRTTGAVARACAPGPPPLFTAPFTAPFAKPSAGRAAALLRQV